jgi:ribulose-phosphate 3-epimerase
MAKVEICPTVTAFDTHEYRVQMERLERFADRIHIDLMDGQFAPTVSPSLRQVWWPEKLTADIHLMYQRPAVHIEQLILMKPNLLVIHFEADVNHAQFSAQLRSNGIESGLAILSETKVTDCLEVIKHYDHVLVFSGKLGYHGGQADMDLTSKVTLIRKTYPKIEISWDGGINDQNAPLLIEAGVNVLNVGGFIQNADNPEVAYAKLKTLM